MYNQKREQRRIVKQIRRGKREQSSQRKGCNVIEIFEEKAEVKL